MGKKIFGGVGKLFGGKKKKAAAAPEDGKPIVTALTEDQAYEAKNGRKRKGVSRSSGSLGTIFGMADAGKLGQ